MVKPEKELSSIVMGKKTLKKEGNTTIDKLAAQNLNIIRKWSLSILKPAQMTRHKLSMRKKRFVVSLHPIQYLEELLEA